MPGSTGETRKQASPEGPSRTRAEISPVILMLRLPLLPSPAAYEYDAWEWKCGGHSNLHARSLFSLSTEQCKLRDDRERLVILNPHAELAKDINSCILAAHTRTVIGLDLFSQRGGGVCFLSNVCFFCQLLLGQTLSNFSLQWLLIDWAQLEVVLEPVKVYHENCYSVVVAKEFHLTIYEVGPISKEFQGWDRECKFITLHLPYEFSNYFVFQSTDPFTNWAKNELQSPYAPTSTLPTLNFHGEHFGKK